MIGKESTHLVKNGNILLKINVYAHKVMCYSGLTTAVNSKHPLTEVK